MPAPPPQGRAQPQRTADISYNFCPSCSAPLNRDDDLDARIAALLTTQLDPLLKARLQDPKLVEVGVTEQVAERVMKWAKYVAFFVGLPLASFAALLGFVGLKTYGDVEKLRQALVVGQTNFDIAVQRAKVLQELASGAEGQLQAITKDISTLGNTLRSRQDDFNISLAQVKTQQDVLQRSVRELQDRLVFAESPALAADVKRSLEERLLRFARYLEDFGFPKPARRATVEIYSDLHIPARAAQFLRVAEAQDRKKAFFDQSDNRIYIHQDLLADASVALREYAHFALFTAVGRQFRQTEVESALADYYPASFLESFGLAGEAVKPVMDRMQVTGRHPGQTDENSLSEIIRNGAFWASAFWQCRKALGRQVVDKSLLESWVASYQRNSDADQVAAFRTTLMESPTAQRTGALRQCLEAELGQRGIPM